MKANELRDAMFASGLAIVGDEWPKVHREVSSYVVSVVRIFLKGVQRFKQGAIDKERLRDLIAATNESMTQVFRLAKYLLLELVDRVVKAMMDVATEAIYRMTGLNFARA